MQDEILGGFKKLNLNPADIKDILITHGHLDHYGGAKYLQDTYHPKVLMGGPDWDALDKPTARAPKPTRDVTVTDGQKVTLGDETITLYVTPGHTAGTVSMLIPVKDNGTPHLAALWGGTGMQFSAKEYSEQAARFRDIAKKAGADIVLSTHSQLDSSDVKLPLAAKAQARRPEPLRRRLANRAGVPDGGERMRSCGCPDAGGISRLSGPLTSASLAAR